MDVTLVSPGRKQVLEGQILCLIDLFNLHVENGHLGWPMAGGLDPRLKMVLTNTIDWKVSP